MQVNQHLLCSWNMLRDSEKDANYDTNPQCKILVMPTRKSTAALQLQGCQVGKHTHSVQVMLREADGVHQNAPLLDGDAVCGLGAGWQGHTASHAGVARGWKHKADLVS